MCVPRAALLDNEMAPSVYFRISGLEVVYNCYPYFILILQFSSIYSFSLTWRPAYFMSCCLKPHRDLAPVQIQRPGRQAARQWACWLRHLHPCCRHWVHQLSCLGHVHPLPEHPGSIPGSAADVYILLLMCSGRQRVMAQMSGFLSSVREFWFEILAPGFAPAHLWPWPTFVE